MFKKRKKELDSAGSFPLISISDGYYYYNQKLKLTTSYFCISDANTAVIEITVSMTSAMVRL